jgi:sulfite exporter TauE/SafE
LQLSARPLLVGMVHGLAGSAALMLLVLSTISSPAVGLAYIGVFGVGSIGGMIAMSALVSLPIHFTAGHFNRANKVVRMLAAIFSLGLGLLMAYRICGLF